MSVCILIFFLCFFGKTYGYDGKLPNGVWGSNELAIRVRDKSTEVEWGCAVATFTTSIQVINNTLNTTGEYMVSCGCDIIDVTMNGYLQANDSNVLYVQFSNYRNTTYRVVLNQPASLPTCSCLEFSCETSDHTATIVILAVVGGIVVIGIIAWIVIVMRWRKGMKTFFLSYRQMKSPPPEDELVST